MKQACKRAFMATAVLLVACGGPTQPGRAEVEAYLTAASKAQAVESFWQGGVAREQLFAVLTFSYLGQEPLVDFVSRRANVNDARKQVEELEKTLRPRDESQSRLREALEVVKRELTLHDSHGYAYKYRIESSTAGGQPIVKVWAIAVVPEKGRWLVAKLIDEQVDTGKGGT